MKREILFSVILHLLIAAAAVISAPFDFKRPPEDQIIRVSLHAAVPMETITPQPIPTPTIPKAVEEDPVEVPIEDLSTTPEAKIEKPVEEPKKEPEKPKTDKPKQYQPRADSGDNSQAGADSGSTEVKAGAGSPFAGATIDNASFDYPYWFTQAFYKIQTNWRNPVATDYAIVCVIYFQVLSSGRIFETRIESSSGISSFDDACLRAVERASPLPQLPKEFEAEIIGITLPFKFEP